MFDPATGSFGNVPQGSPPTKLNAHLVNTGTLPVTIKAVGIPVTTGKGAKKTVKYVATSGPVTVAAPCVGKVLQPQQVCDIAVTSVNTAAGARSVTLRAVTAAGTSADFTAKGRVLRRALTIKGPIQLGLLDRATPRVGKIVVTNSGELPVVVASVALTNPAKSGFTISGDQCTNAQLKPGATCALNVQGLLTVQPAGAVTDRIVAKGSTGETGQADVIARSPRRAITMTPKVLDFGQVGPGAAVARKATIRNVGDAPVTVQAVTVSGPGAPAYKTTAGSDCVGAVIAVKATCVVTITGSSPAAGAYSATVTATGTQKETAATTLRMRVGTATTITGLPIPLTPTTTVPPPTIAPCAVTTLVAEAVAPRGRPVNFTATGFPANSAVQIGWASQSMRNYTADGNGQVRGAIMILSSDPLGERVLNASAIDTPSCPPATAKVLVVLDTASPRRPLTRSRPVVR